MSIKEDAAVKGLEWIEKSIKYFQPYRPVISRITMNYRKNISQVLMVVDVNERIKPKIMSIRVPSSYEFRLVSIKDMMFIPIISTPKYNIKANEWIIDTSKLPPSDRYFFELEGPVPPDFFKDHVRIDRAHQRNRKHDGECDTYWLAASLQKTGDLTAISKFFEIEEIDIKIKIALENHISTTLPFSIRNLLDKKSQWDRAADGKDPNLKLIRSRYKAAVRQSKISVEELIKILEHIIEPDVFIEYLNADDPFDITKIYQLEKQIPPKSVSVETITNLSLENQNPTGFLTFKKKKFNDDLLSQIS